MNDHRPWSGSETNKGFTVIELLITTFVIGVVVVGLFGLFFLSLRTAGEGERRIVATALASERMEAIRGLSYNHVGIVDGALPGDIEALEEITRNNVPYTVSTAVEYVDDPFDGVSGEVTGDADPLDYKKVTVNVSWSSPNDIRPVTLTTFITPQDIEDVDGKGSFTLKVIDSNGIGVSGATVTITSNSISPAVNLTETTDSQGAGTVSDLPEGVEAYGIEVSKAGYTTETTYDPTSTFFPDSEHTHLTVLSHQVTEKTVVIDTLSSLTLIMQNESGSPIADVPFVITGTKRIGKDEEGKATYAFYHADTTNASGTVTYPDISWDSFSLTLDGVASGYDIKKTEVVMPFVVNPGEEKTAIITLVEHTDNSLHVTVTDMAGNPLQNTDVVIEQGEFSQTFSTDEFGQVFFGDIETTGEYTIHLSHEGYYELEETTTINGTNRRVFKMSPV